MISLIAAALFFVGIHVLISGTGLRAVLVRQLGERGYLVLFSLLSALGLAGLIMAFLAQRVPLPTAWLDWRWLAAALNAVAFVMITFGGLVRSPTAVGGERLLAAAEPATGMQRITRHPMLWGIALWAGVHLLFNPQPAPLVFFGAFLTLAVLGARSIDAKRARTLGAAWTHYSAATSSLPFAAIITGRNRLVLRELWAPPLAAGLGAFLLFLLLHGRLFRMPAF